MSRIIFYMAFLLNGIPVLVNGQPYQSLFGRTSTQWKYACANLPGPFTGYAYVEGDSILNGLHYKKITTQRPNSMGYRGALIREDTLAGKVWFKAINLNAPYTDAAEYLMYRYDLQPGDSFSIKGGGVCAMYAGANPANWSHVDSVRIKGGLKHIYFRPASTEGNPEPFAIIEGIGTMQGILYNLEASIETAQYLLCSYKDSIKTSFVNKAFNGSCELPTSVTQITPSTQISIFPNPVSNVLFVRLTDVQAASVYDLQGRLVNKTMIYVPNKGINVRELAPGMYILRLENKQGNWMQKFVKE